MPPPETNITLYTAGTPNGQKISCTLEELGIEYTVHKIDLSKNEQKEEWFLEINRQSCPVFPTPPKTRCFARVLMTLLTPVR